MKKAAVLALASVVSLTQCRYDRELPLQIEHPRYGGIHIERNAKGVPEITAQNPEGAAFGLGYMHACDRQLQTTLTRIGFAGRSSELAKDDELLA